MLDPYGTSNAPPPGKFKSRSEAEEFLTGFLSKKCDIEKGDFVVRNRMGSKRYLMPRNDQAAVCVGFIKPRTTDISGCRIGDDMIIAIAEGPDVVNYFSVNSKYYEKADAAPKNLVLFRGRK